MIPSKTTELRIGWTAAAIIAASLVFWLAGVSRGAMSDAIDATCRITTADGSCGTGCTFEISQGAVFVLTAAHVVGQSDQVQCEFWQQGHKSAPLAARVVAREPAADAAVVALSETTFGGRLPAVVPLAPRDYVVRPGQTLASVGCAGGSWSTGWKGHALGYAGADLRFLPAPANGRSGSALLDADARQIVGVVRARTGDDAQGIATSVQAIYQALGRGSAAAQTHQGEGDSPIFAETKIGTVPETKIGTAASPCGPQGCPARPEPWQNHLLPYRYRHEQSQQPQQPQQPAPAPVAPAPWPTLPEPSARSAADLGAVEERLGRIAGMLDELKSQRQSSGAPTPPATSPSPAPTIDAQARQAVEAVVGQLTAVRDQSQRDIQEVKTEATKAQQAVGGLSTVVERIKESISEHGTLSQQFHARVDRVKGELEERLGREATDREVRLGYIKDLIQEKISEGGLVGLAKALGLWASTMKVSRTSVDEAVRELLQRVKWDGKKAWMLVQDSTKPLGKEDREADAKRRTERRRKEQARRKANKKRLEINKKIRAVTKEWRKREAKRIEEKNKWHWGYSRYLKQSEEQRARNKEQRQKDNDWRKKNDKWREAEVKKICQEESIVSGLTGLKLEPTRLAKERTDREVAVQLVRRAGGLRNALERLERAVKRRKGS